MYLTEKTKSIRTILYSLAVVGIASAGLWFGAQSNTTHASVNTSNTLVAAPAATFAGSGFGAIPDGPGTPTLCGSDGTPRNVTFNVTGLSGAPTNVEVSMTFGSPVHTFVGDITAVLIAPNGASQTLFGYTGSTVSSGCGDASDLAGPYTFSDNAPSPPSGGWWQAATTAGTTTAIASGTYRTTARGGAGATNPQPPTNLTAAFAGVSDPNGTWTLRLTDGGGGDTGGITAATLTVDAAGSPTPTPTPAAAQHVVDFDGNGKTDLVVVRNTGGGASGQVTWYVSLNGPGTASGTAWGIASDFFVPEDFDGDNKTDYAIWRPVSTGAPSGNAFFYILQSATNTVRIDDFGQSGDDPTVVGDYDGDGKADPAVYRSGATAGAPSTWYYRGSLTPSSVSAVQWGQNGDFPAPGDYDGDGKNDFVTQRNNGGGTAAFWRHMTTAGNDVVVFGTPTDVIVPGDYDGDGKTDIATIRGSAGSILWFARRSSDGGTNFYTWGASATDFPTQGDYDGDGKTDVAVWRPSATPGASAFYALGSTSGPIIASWGANGDYPVANYNSH